QAALLLRTLIITASAADQPPDLPRPQALPAGLHFNESDVRILRHAVSQFHRGRQIFREDTFGSERFWGDILKLHQAIAGESLGGVGPGVSPRAALAVGLKVDV